LRKGESFKYKMGGRKVRAKWKRVKCCNQIDNLKRFNHFTSTQFIKKKIR